MHYFFYDTRVKLRIKTDCQQFEMKEDNVNAEVIANNIDLKPVTSPSNEYNSPNLTLEQENEVDVVCFYILYKNELTAWKLQVVLNIH